MLLQCQAGLHAQARASDDMLYLIAERKDGPLDDSRSGQAAAGWPVIAQYTTVALLCSIHGRLWPWPSAPRLILGMLHAFFLDFLLPTIAKAALHTGDAFPR